MGAQLVYAIAVPNLRQTLESCRASIQLHGFSTWLRGIAAENLLSIAEPFAVREFSTGGVVKITESQGNADQMKFLN